MLLRAAGGRPAEALALALREALAALARTPRLLVALDFDGTLSPLVDEPMAARMLPAARDAVYAHMATLNKKAGNAVRSAKNVHACTDVTGFALLGHSLEMAQGSGVTVHLKAQAVPYHEEAYEMADMGFVPAGAYRNRDFAEAGVRVVGAVARALQDIFYDPQTSGGLLCAVPAAEAEACLAELRAVAPSTQIIGYVTEKLDSAIYLEA